MQILGKTLAEYWQSSKKYLIIYLVIVTSISVARLILNYFPVASSIVLANSVILWAGWEMVGKHNFNLKQTLVVGVLMALITAWTILIFDPVELILIKFFTNILFSGFTAVMGGFFAKLHYRNR